MKQIVDLRPNRDLLDNEFTGYSLSLDSFPIYEKSFEIAVDFVKPSESQYSYAHVRLFSLHNHLHANPYTPRLVYFVDEQWRIMQVSIGPMNRVENILRVCDIPRSIQRKPGHFPVSIHFASADRAVIADGAGSFHVAAVKKDKWVIVFSDTTLSDGGVMVSASLVGGRFYILSRAVVEPKFDSVLHFLVLDENWQTLSFKRVQVSGNVQFMSIESPSSLLVITDGQQRPPKFLKPSEVVELPDTKPKYLWVQTAEEVSIAIDVKTIENSDIKVETDGQKLTVVIKDEEIINGDFAHSVGPVTWEVEDGELEILAQKEEVGLGWQEVISGDSNGLQLHTSPAEEVEGSSFNAEELEEVDVAPASALLRLDMEKDQVTHEVNLSTMQFLFPVTVDPQKPPAVCVRHLTDACVWQFQSSPDSTSWQQTHVGTFSAFGYVQASKTLRKFIVAPPNLSYVTICEAFRHLYVFRQPSPVTGELRNRWTGSRVNAVAIQQLLSLETDQEILGMTATNNHLFVLTKKQFYVLVIN